MRGSLINAAAMALAFAALAVASQVHAGMPCWIQGLNYLVASVPFGLSAAHALRFARFGERRSRRLAAYYLIIFAGIAVYAWRSVERHRELVDAEERALAPAIAALADYRERTGRYPETLEEIGARPQEPIRFRLTYGTRAEASSYTLMFTHNLVRKHTFVPESGVWTDWD
jgi:hypothetical protein